MTRIRTFDICVVSAMVPDNAYTGGVASVGNESANSTSEITKYHVALSSSSIIGGLSLPTCSPLPPFSSSGPR